MTKNKTTEEKTITTVAYDERRKILTITISGKAVEGKYQRIFTYEGEEKIRTFVNRIRKDKQKDQDMINSSEKTIADVQDKKEDLQKMIPELTEELKKFKENAEALGKYKPLNEATIQLKTLKETLKPLKQEFQDNKTFLNEIESKIKFKV